MYYHSRPLKYVTCGKVYPAPPENLDGDLSKAYAWLGRYCGFYPQIWLARSRSVMTPFRSRDRSADYILFGFDYVKGFPVQYDLWCCMMASLINAGSPERGNAALREQFQGWVEDEDARDTPWTRAWLECRDVEKFLRRQLFVENDQVVVPSLNLKAAKEILCHNERQKKKLRHIGFIEDRIRIVNVRKNPSC